MDKVHGLDSSGGAGPGRPCRLPVKASGILPPEPRRQAGAPYRLRIDSGREITLVSNDLKGPAAEIAAFYKQRWQIELFFKCIKQNPKIRHFLRASENAVRIQLIAALIAYP